MHFYWRREYSTFICIMILVSPKLHLNDRLLIKFSLFVELISLAVVFEWLSS